MAHLGGANLSKVDVFASSVLDAPLSDTWAEARNFGQGSFWDRAGQGEFKVKKTSTKAVTELGCERLFSIGHARLFEELSGLDDLEHIVRWILVSHPHTLSPFGQASFLNYTSSLQLRAVTVSNQTYAEWRGSFYTEPHYAAQMESVLESWYFAGFKGLEASSKLVQPAEIPAPTMPYPPTALNPNHSIPVQPPPVDHLAFHSSEVRATQNGLPSNIGINSGGGMAGPFHAANQNGGPKSNNGYTSQPDFASERYIQGPALQNQQSRQVQQARAAFGHPTSSRGSGKSIPSTPASPAAMPRIPQQVMSARAGPSSNTSSAESIDQGNRGRRTTEFDQPQVTSGYHSALGSIEEDIQRDEVLDPTFQGPAYGPSTMSRHAQNLNLAAQPSSGCSSLSSNGSQQARNRSQIGQHGVAHSFDGNSKSKPRRTAEAPARRSWQGDESFPARPGSASAMKAEAMQAFQVPSNVPSRRKASRSRRPQQLRPDWEAMKETAYLNDEADAKLMANVAQNVGDHLLENTERNSLEQEVAKLQERHEQLHGRKSTTDKPFVSPFSASVSPFESSAQPESTARPNPFAAAQPDAAVRSNPFAAAQPTGSPRSSG